MPSALRIPRISTTQSFTHAPAVPIEATRCPSPPMKSHARRAGERIGLILAGIDHLKKINDSCSHDTCDKVPAHMSRVPTFSCDVTALSPSKSFVQYGGRSCQLRALLHRRSAEGHNTGNGVSVEKTAAQLLRADETSLGAGV
jgi:predicted signal transduction protein with EAL and GGDEF domain